jgi:hypothetical protein
MANSIAAGAYPSSLYSTVVLAACVHTHISRSAGTMVKLTIFD